MKSVRFSSDTGRGSKVSTKPSFWASLPVLVLFLVAVLLSNNVADKRIAVTPLQPEVIRDANNMRLDTNAPLMVKDGTFPEGSGLISVPSLLQEIGTMVLFQTVGVGVLSKVVVSSIRRFKILRLHRVLNHKVVPRVWKGMRSIYHKTAAARIVNRSKKFLHGMHEHSHDGEHAEEHRPRP